jgi:hypothetical protein
VGKLMNVELEGIWKEVIEVHPGILLEGLRRSTKNFSQDEQAEIRNEQLFKTSQEHGRLS